MQKPYRFKINESSFAHYWKEGVGAELLNELGFIPDLKSAEKFIPLLYEWDRVGDQLVIDIHDKIGFKNGNLSLENYLKGFHVDDAQRGIWDIFFNQIEINPSWLEIDKLRK